MPAVGGWTMPWEWASASRAGTHGPNQDAVWHSEDGRLCVIADGASLSDSRAASGTCVTVARRLYSTAAGTRLLIEISTTVNRELLARVCAGEAVGATSFSAVHSMTPYQAMALALGDSPIFVVRDGTVQAEVEPLRRYERMVRGGRITREQAETVFARAPWWTQTLLGMFLPQPLPDINSDPVELAIMPGDRLVLCTDGVSDVVTPDEVAAAAHGRSPAATVAWLLATAHARGSTDDRSCAVGVWSGETQDGSSGPATIG